MAESIWCSSRWQSPCPSSGMCLCPVVSPTWTWRGWCRAPGTEWRSFLRLGLIVSPLRLPSATQVGRQPLRPCPTSGSQSCGSQLHSQAGISPGCPSPAPVTLFLSHSPATSTLPVRQPCGRCLGSGCALGDPSRAEGRIPAQRAGGKLLLTSKEPGTGEGQHQHHPDTADTGSMLSCWDLGSSRSLLLPPQEHHWLHR